MPDSQQEKLDPAKKVRVPVPKGPKLISKEAWVRLLHLVFHFLGVKLEIVGASAGGKSGDKAGLQVKPGTGEEGEDEGDGYEPWDPPENEDCPCGEGPVLKAKKTYACGVSRCCSLGVVPPGDPAYPASYGKRVTTQNCTLLDYTGPELMFSSCVRIISVDGHVSGSGTLGGPCSEGLPDCGATDTDIEDGCDAPMCGGIPEPGFKCYEVDDEEIVRSKFCTDDTQAAAAADQAEMEVEEDFTVESVEAMIGATSVNDPELYIRSSWEFKRYGRRKRTKVVITWRNTAGMTEDTYEDEIEMVGMTDSGIFELEPVGAEAVAEILNVEVIYGKDP